MNDIFLHRHQEAADYEGRLEMWGTFVTLFFKIKTVEEIRYVLKELRPQLTSRPKPFPVSRKRLLLWRWKFIATTVSELEELNDRLGKNYPCLRRSIQNKIYKLKAG